MIKALLWKYGMVEGLVVEQGKIVKWPYDEKKPTDKEIQSILKHYEDFEQKQNRIEELKQFLRETDYVGLSDYDGLKPDVIAQRAEWRKEVRELENVLNPS